MLAIDGYEEFNLAMKNRRIRFAQISDIHLMPEGSCRCWWMPAPPEQLLQEAIDQIQAIPDLDFVVFTGDIVDRADAASFRRFRKIIGELSVPYVCSVGNHDIAEDGIVPFRDTDVFTRTRFLDWCQEQFPCDISPTGWADFATTPVPGVRIIALDASLGTWPDPQGVLRREQLDWLEAELADHPDELIVLAIHQPPLASMLFRAYRIVPAHRRRLRQVMQTHSHIVAVLSGHLHTPKVYRRQHTTFLTAPPLVGPVSGFRLFDIDTSPNRTGNVQRSWGLLRYSWHRVHAPKIGPEPLWYALAMGRSGDRHGQTAFPLPPSWSLPQSTSSPAPCLREWA